MSDFKSKLPDLKELASMTGKLFTDIKHSVSGIIEEYKKKRATVADKKPADAATTPAPAPEKPTPATTTTPPDESAKEPEVKKEAPKEEPK